MTAGTLIARPDQVAELTRGVQLPFRPLEKMHLTVVVETLSSAWTEVVKVHSEVTSVAGEIEINSLMTARLNALLDTDELWRQLVRAVTRGTESISYDGSHLEKRPDLSIHLTNRNPSFPLTVECKLLDVGSGKTVKLYCDQGLSKFIKGEYAWTVPEAFMLGYVRDGSSIQSSLAPFLLESEKAAPSPYLVVALPEDLSHPTADVARSRHNRNFNYVGEPPHTYPGPISIWHVWLSDV